MKPFFVFVFMQYFLPDYLNLQTEYVLHFIAGTNKEGFIKNKLDFRLTKKNIQVFLFFTRLQRIYNVLN